MLRKVVILSTVAVVVMLCWAGSANAQVVIETVTSGNPGNAGQLPGQGVGDVPFVQAEIADHLPPPGNIAGDGPRLRPNHPPFDQIPPAPMPMTVDQRAPTDPGAPVFHDAITGETIVLPIDRALSDKLGEIPGYDGADGGLGGEDRTRTFWDMYRITNTEDFPWRMNVKLVMHFVDEIGDDRWFSCSGSMIDAETVLCAGHCVYLRAVNGPDIFDWAEEIWVYPGRDGDEYPYGYGHGTLFGAWTGWTDGGSFDYDAGLIEITRAVGMLTGWFGKAWDGSCSWVLGQTYNNASYPGEDCPDPGLHTGVHMYYWYGHFDSCPGNQLQINTGGGHCFDTVWGGMSGSGAYYIDSGSCYVHAVCSNSNRTTSGRYCKLWGDWASFMNGTFIPGARGNSFDLQALDANAEPATVPAGSALSLADFLAANPTNASASGTWTVRTYQSTNDDISSGDTLLGTEVFTWTFPPMSSVRVGLGNPTIPINTPPGYYWFGVELDSTTDGNSSNNSTDGWDAVPLTVTPAPPPNDDCGSAIIIPNTPIAPYDPPLLDTRGATSAASDPLQTCTYNGPNRNSNTVWYRYTPPCDGLLNINTCGSNYDTVLSVLTGSCGSLTEIACNDDACGAQSEIIGLAVAAFEPLYIEVSHSDQPTYRGDLDFHLDFVPTGIPSNDDCANAQFVGIPSSTIGTTNCASPDNAPGCGTSITSPGVWYRVIGTGRMLTASTCNEFSTYDTKISVYCNSCDTLTCVAGNDDDCVGYPPVLSTVSWCSQYGAEYLILVHGFGGQTGGFLLDVYQGDAPCSGAVECGSEPPGACCFDNPNRLCDVMTQADCDNLAGVYMGNGTSCEGMEACCMPWNPPGSDCIDADALCCRDVIAGFTQGPGTACTATEACCMSDGSCEDVDPLCCDDEGGHASPIGAPACMGDTNGNGQDDACETPQACCFPDGSCMDDTPVNCLLAGGQPLGSGTSCVTLPAAESICTDGLDDDCDGCVDGADSDCGGTETSCTDGIDNDCDGSTDCNDSDCIGGTEANCSDGLDDDCDGCVDGVDSDCGGTETVCNDAVDNDCDGLVDCADPDCVPGSEVNCCNDGVDNDNDGCTDGVDSDCGGTETICNDSIDNDCDGLTDCNDPDCVSGTETNCTDGIDNDCDGLTDCNDPDCTTDPACEACCQPFVSCYEATAADCSNAGGTPQGAGSDCLGPVACCKPDGTCLFVDEQCCDYEGGTSQGSGSDCDPNPCCVIADPPTQPVGEAGYEKVRYISMEPGNTGRQTALRVHLKSLPPPFAGFNSTKCWVGEPQQVSENSGKIAHEPGWPDFMSANLQGTPLCMDWSTVGVLHVTDDDIIPSAVYDVQAIDCECDFNNEANYSAPLTITTSKWGDLVGHCAVIPCTPPEGVVNMATDVTACLDKFRNLGGAVLKSRADIEPNFPDWLVNISDVTYVLDAFRGFAYPAAQTPPAPGWPGPDGCP